jgi:hypothetical protein
MRQFTTPGLLSSLGGSPFFQTIGHCILIGEKKRDKIPIKNAVM